MGKQKEHKIIKGLRFKYCKSCKEWLLLTRFGKSKNNWDGLQSRCKTCQKEYYFTETKRKHREEKLEKQYNIRTKRYYEYP